MTLELIVLEPLNIPLAETNDLQDCKIAIFFEGLPGFVPVLSRRVRPRVLGSTEVVASTTGALAQISIPEHRKMSARRVCGCKAFPQVIGRCARGLQVQEVS